MVLFFTRTVHNLYFSSLQLLHNYPGGVGPSYLLDKALRALETDVISVAQILLHPALVISLY